MTTRIRFYWGSNFRQSSGAILGDFIVQEATVKRGVNEIGDFSFMLPVASLHALNIPLEGYLAFGVRKRYFASVYQDGVQLISGEVDNVSVTYLEDELNYKFSCNGELAELSRVKAKSNAVYQNMQIVAILCDLLDGVSDWRVGDFSTMEDPLLTTTIDLRGEKHLFPQITKLLSSVPNVFFRYGGAYIPNLYGGLFLEGTYNRIDIGVFNRENDTHIPSESILQLGKTITYTNTISRVEAYGGEIELAGVKRRINLNDAYNYDSSLRTAYSPITFGTAPSIPNVMTNSAVDGENMVEYFDEIVPTTKVDPTLTEINQAGYALFLKTLSLMQQNSDYENRWQATLNQLPEDFKLGEQIFLRANAGQIFYDYVTQAPIILQIEQVAEWFRVNGYTLEIKNDEVKYKLEVSTNLRLSKLDPIVELYNASANVVVGDDTTLSIPINQYRVQSVTIPAGSMADTYVEIDGETYPAKSAVISLLPIPAGETNAYVYALPFVKEENGVVAVAESISNNPDTNLDVSVSINNDWTVSDTTTVYLLVRYDDH